jgi:DNA-binding transcriptional ArsR family regulator
VGKPAVTVSRWCKELGIDPSDRSSQYVNAATLAAQGCTLDEIAEATGLSKSTLQRHGIHTAPAIERRAPKKERYGQQAITLHQQGRTVYEIAADIGNVYWGTVAQWLRDEGFSPNFGTSSGKAEQIAQRDPRAEEVIKRYLAGEAVRAIAVSLKMWHRTAEQIIKDADLAEQGGKYKRREEKYQKACILFQEGKPIQAVIKESGLSYYQARIALDRANLLPYPDSEKPVTRCPCGKLTGDPSVKYCSPLHRVEYGGKRQADPANQVTAICQNPDCPEPGRRFTHPRSQGYRKYHNDECAQQHKRPAEQLNDLE